MCAKSASIAIFTFRNVTTTNRLFSPVKAFDPDLKVLEPRVHDSTYKIDIY